MSGACVNYETAAFDRRLHIAGISDIAYSDFHFFRKQMLLTERSNECPD